MRFGMRKIIVLTFVSLDGVMQAPGGPEEDPSGGFKYGGWMVNYGDEFLMQEMMNQMSRPYEALLGRKTYEIFASYWPHANPDEEPLAGIINRSKKYVVSKTLQNPSWENTIVINGDVVAEIKRLKNMDGPELQVSGSSNLIQTLLKHDLIDEFWLKIFPVTLGTGKRLFGEGTLPAAFTLQKCEVSQKGVIIASYVRDGELKTGSFAR
ncbi:dihydrofolate reductase family protein [Methanosphaerula subterraneus]|uniref:dihydrofolate reductase family protein n=1 Tax=Methanosphaerula subterraneus TaxID=3350244 RepID=UPI003F84CE1C